MCFIQRMNKLQGCYNALMLIKCLVCSFLFVFAFSENLHKEMAPFLYRQIKINQYGKGYICSYK